MLAYDKKVHYYESWVKYNPNVVEWADFKRKKTEIHNLKFDMDKLVYYIRPYVALLRSDPNYYNMPDTRNFGLDLIKFLNYSMGLK
jgi:hypothetical protein